MMRRVLSILFICLSFTIYFGTINALSGGLHKNTFTNNNQIDKKSEIRIKKVRLISMPYIRNKEPLVIRAVVLKNNGNKTIAKITSGHYRGFILEIKGKLNVKKGYYITGCLYKNMFAITPFKGRLK